MEIILLYNRRSWETRDLLVSIDQNIVRVDKIYNIENIFIKDI